MGAKLELLKNTFIDILVILLSYINFTYIYLILFLNKKPMQFKITDISAKYAITSSFPTDFSAYSFLLFINPITLNLFWVDEIPSFDQVLVLCILLEFIFSLSIFFAYLEVSTEAILLILYIYKLFSFLLEQIFSIYFANKSIALALGIVRKYLFYVVFGIRLYNALFFIILYILKNVQLFPKLFYIFLNSDYISYLVY